MKALSRIGKQCFASTVKFTFVLRDGIKKPVEIQVGKNILDAAKQNDVDLEGACEASLACSTCHVILPSTLFNKLANPSEEEEDLLDLAFGLTATSRLGCQVKVDQTMEGTQITLPKASRNLYVDKSKSPSK